MQRTCVKWFRLQYPNLKKVFFAVPNGGRRDARTAALMQGEGIVPGVSDLILLVPRREFHGLCIEMKYGKNGLSQHQQDFKAEVQKHGYRYVTCYGFDAFQREVEFYLGTRPEFIPMPARTAR